MHTGSTWAIPCTLPPIHATIDLVPRKFTHLLDRSRSGRFQRHCSRSDHVLVHFIDQDVLIAAEPKEPLTQVAERAGVHLELGCNTGSCGICEVEVRKFQGCDEPSSVEAPAVVRACIARVPPGYSRLEISQLSDSIWGSDGWDT